MFKAKANVQLNIRLENHRVAIVDRLQKLTVAFFIDQLDSY